MAWIDYTAYDETNTILSELKMIFLLRGKNITGKKAFKMKRVLVHPIWHKVIKISVKVKKDKLVPVVELSVTQ